VSLSVYSAFRYGHTVDISNRDIDFKEGTNTRHAVVPVGSYTLTKLLQVVADALNSVGSNDYSLSVDYQTGIITLTSSGSFDSLGATGENASTSIFSLLGFASVDSLGITTIIGGERSGSIYYPQFFLQNYMPTKQNLRASDSTVSKSASGLVSVQKFGDERFMKCDLLFINDLVQPPGSLIKTNLTGYEDALAFLEYCITKAPIEFIEDVSSPDEFEPLLLESTPTDKSGTGFELVETFARNLPFYYEIKPLIFRLAEGQ